MKELHHLAIIMDGNGRWAKQKRKPRYYGHIQGVRVAKKTITDANERGLQYLTLYAFSSENWNRPHDEVRILMALLKKYLSREKKSLKKNNIRFQVIGQIERLPTEVLSLIRELVYDTSQNTGMVLTLALSYGGREDILSAAKKLVYLHLEKKVSLDSIDTESFKNLLDTHSLPDPDLVIRTSGEKRLSNFLLWQSAYSEFYFLDKHWPDFNEKDLDKALEDFKNRERRFGKTSEQLSSEGDLFLQI